MKDFHTDGCSTMSNLWYSLTRKTLPWRNDCIHHDVEYWMGGSKGDRWHTDIKLLCDVATRGYPICAMFMYWVVRFGGVWWLPFPWRWGYGNENLTRHFYRTEMDTFKVNSLHKTNHVSL